MASRRHDDKRVILPDGRSARLLRTFPRNTVAYKIGMTDESVGSDMLHITEADVKRLVSFPKAIELVRDAYSKLARGEADNPARIFLPVKDGVSLYLMPAYVQGHSTLTVKAARANPQNNQRSLPTVLLTIYAYDSETGVQTAHIEADWLTAMRTAASSAVATDLLAEKNVRVLGIFGSGVEARSHVLALMHVRDFEVVLAYSRDANRRDGFAKQLSQETGISIQAVRSPDSVATKADVIVTATTSRTPVFDGKLVKSGALVNAIGNATPNGREVDTILVERSRVVVDSRDQAFSTYGDIMIPVKEGTIRGSEIHELGDLLVKKSKLVPLGDANVTLFKAGGLAVLDAMVVDHILTSLRS